MRRFMIVLGAALALATSAYALTATLGGIHGPVGPGPGGAGGQQRIPSAMHHCKTGVPCGHVCLAKGKVCHSPARIDPYKN